MSHPTSAQIAERAEQIRVARAQLLEQHPPEPSVRSLRLALRGLDHDEVAECAGVDVRTVRSLANGKRKPQQRVLDNIELAIHDLHPGHQWLSSPFAEMLDRAGLDVDALLRDGDPLGERLADVITIDERLYECESLMAVELRRGHWPSRRQTAASVRKRHSRARS